MVVAENNYLKRKLKRKNEKKSMRVIFRSVCGRRVSQYSLSLFILHRNGPVPATGGPERCPFN
jgi:hypothetical protein